MKLNWREIYEGFRNDLFPPEKLKDLIKETQEERLAICLDCPFNSTCGKITNISTCKLCGCFLKKKTACLSCHCGAFTYNQDHPEDQQPIKWAAVTTSEIETEIDNKLKTN